MNGATPRTELTMDPPRAAPRAWLALVVVGAASVGLVSFVDDGAWALAMRYAPGLSFVGRYRLSSLFVCAALARCAGGSGALRLPGKDVRWRLVAPAALFWTLGTGVAVLGFRVWTPTRSFRAPADYAAFLGTGLLAEELLFRGAVFELASRAFPGKRSPLFGPAVWISAALFAASHAQYHHYRLTPASVAQELYTLPMGVVLAFVRKHTKSLWPGAAVHLVCNALSVVRSAFFL